MLAEHMTTAGVPCVAVREPGGTPVGDAIREILLDPERQITAPTEALLFMASRAELIAREIKPSIGEGKTVLLDRFFLSTYAYQIVGRGLPEENVRAANRLATAGLVPDLTLLIDIAPSTGLERADARGSRDRMERADDDFHRRVAEAFRSFTNADWQNSHPECGPIMLIDGGGDENQVFARVVAALKSSFPKQFDRVES
jgi:dTMP kinase